MADKVLPDHELPARPTADERVDSERRVFLRRAAIAGLPVVLASVRGRSVWASTGTASCPASATISACNGQ